MEAKQQQKKKIFVDLVNSTSSTTAVNQPGLSCVIVLKLTTDFKYLWANVFLHTWLDRQTRQTDRPVDRRLLNTVSAPDAELIVRLYSKSLCCSVPTWSSSGTGCPPLKRRMVSRWRGPATSMSNAPFCSCSISRYGRRVLCQHLCSVWQVLIKQGCLFSPTPPQPPQYKLDPRLSRLLGVHTQTRASIMQALWLYIKNNKLQDCHEKEYINCNRYFRQVTRPNCRRWFGFSLKWICLFYIIGTHLIVSHVQIFGCPRMRFAEIPMKLAGLLQHPDPVIINHIIRYGGADLTSLLASNMTMDFQRFNRLLTAVWIPPIKRKRRATTLTWRWRICWRVRWTIFCPPQLISRRLQRWRWRWMLGDGCTCVEFQGRLRGKCLTWRRRLCFVHCRFTRQSNTSTSWRRRGTSCLASATIHRSSSRTGSSLRAETWRWGEKLIILCCSGLTTVAVCSFKEQLTEQESGLSSTTLNLKNGKFLVLGCKALCRIVSYKGSVHKKNVLISDFNIGKSLIYTHYSKTINRRLDP